TDPEQFAQELYGVQQIEVLKGPQGALYGRDAIGGAIIITTTPPTNQAKGEITLSRQRAGGARPGHRERPARFRRHSEVQRRAQLLQHGWVSREYLPEPESRSVPRLLRQAEAALGSGERT